MTYTKRQLEAQCRHRLRSGIKKSNIIKFLIEEGLDESSATSLIVTTLSELRSQSILQAGIGFALALIGVIVSIIFTYSSEGMFVFLWWGPALIGFIIGVIGILKFLKLYAK